MSERELPNATQTATVDSDGTATTVGYGPVQYGDEYEILRYSINLSEGTGKCTLYRDYVSTSRQADYTRSGQGDTSENNSIKLRVGNTLIAQWTDATPGAIATIVYYGILKNPYRRY